MNVNRRDYTEMNVNNYRDYTAEGVKTPGHLQW